MSRTMLQLGVVVAMLLAMLLAMLSAVRLADAATPNSIPSTNAVSTLAFLRRFGYLEGGGPPATQPGDSIGDRFSVHNGTTGRPDSETLYTEEAVVEAIKLVQKFGAIEETGVLDEPTQKLMTARRCGCPDVPRRTPFSTPLGPAWSDRRRKRKRRFVLASSGWKKRHLKYYIANWTPKIGEDAVNDQMVRAFDAWSAYGRLRFSRVLQPGDADITVAFGRGNHGDWFPFDGPGGVLAHAFYPYEMASYGGDIHFDDDEQWAANPNSTEVSMGAVDLFLVAVHELGHSLGLGHSPDPHSIMFPYYQSKSDSFQLGQDDILAMYELYIKRQLDGDNETPDISFGGEERPERPTTSRPTRKPPTTTRRPRPRPTTTTTTPRPRRPTTTTTARPHHHHPPSPPQRPTATPTFVGDDETVDEHKKHDDKHRIPAPVPPVGPLSPSGVADGGDKGSSSSSAERENEVPDLCAGSYDAVAQLRGELFVFKGQYLWRLRRPGAVMHGYPVPLRRMFTDLPEYVTSLDAVYQREDGNIVLFSGPRYWVYNGVDFIENSPQPITNYRLPSYVERIDAVMVWAKNKATYFFRNSEFWRYNTTTMDMDRGYPKQIARNWKGVPDKIDDAMTWTDDITYFF